MSLDKTITVLGFLNYQREVRKLAHGSIKDMRCTFKHLSNFCLTYLEVNEIWELNLSQYIQFINYLKDRHQKTKTINKMLSQIRSLINYVWQQEKVDRNVLNGFHLKEDEITQDFESISIDEAKALISAFGEATPLERRNRTVLLVLYGCGLRTSELINLTMPSLRIETQELLVMGKGSKERLLPLSDKVFSELIKYLQDRKGKSGPLFKTHHKKTKMSVSYVGNIIKLAAKRVHLEKMITPKTLRHAFASHLLNAGVDIATVSVLMGHRSPRETGVYIHAEKSNLESAIFKMQEEITHD